MHPHDSLSSFAADLTSVIDSDPGRLADDPSFSDFALRLFHLQFRSNPFYRVQCEAAGTVPGSISHWHRIPPVHTRAFTEFEVTSLSPEQRRFVFHSSATGGDQPSRHYHHQDSLRLYECSLSAWFTPHLLPSQSPPPEFVSMTPPPDLAPRSSLVHMLAFLAASWPAPQHWLGTVNSDGSWALEMDRFDSLLDAAVDSRQPVFIAGTAFNFVHWLDHTRMPRKSWRLPAGSRVMETGGYKGRSRSIPKEELHEAIRRALGIGREWIVTEYGMCELSSQAYDRRAGLHQPALAFRFPPWARAHIVSPEHGRPVSPGQTGILQVIDLANVWSVLAIRTEDLVRALDQGFEWVGRIPLAESRGCSLLPDPGFFAQPASSLESPARI